jgi:hypothetical protein
MGHVTLFRALTKEETWEASIFQAVLVGRVGRHLFVSSTVQGTSRYVWLSSTKKTYPRVSKERS